MFVFMKKPLTKGARDENRPKSDRAWAVICRDRSYIFCRLPAASHSCPNILAVFKPCYDPIVSSRSSAPK